MHRSALGVCAGWLLGLLVGCTAPGDARAPRSAAPVGNGDGIVPDSGEFTVAENMLDTWNTIGQILVALEGVRYEGRAQMLGLYSVRYRGEPFLIRTQAVLIGAASPGIQTRVGALGTDGKPTQSAAAVALLHILAQRVPSEVARYRQRIRLRPDKPAPPRPRRHRSGQRRAGAG